IFPQVVFLYLTNRFQGEGSSGQKCFLWKLDEPLILPTRPSGTVAATSKLVAFVHAPRQRGNKIPSAERTDSKCQERAVTLCKGRIIIRNEAIIPPAGFKSVKQSTEYSSDKAIGRRSIDFNIVDSIFLYLAIQCYRGS